MWKLTIEDDEGKQTQLPLAHEEYGLGRGDGNSIRLTDRNVSRKHAILKRNGQGWFIKDLQSYNGTYVNGVRVAGEQLINGGDVIQLGDYRVELVDESKVQPAADASAQQGALAQVPVHQRPNRLVVVVGPNPGTEYPLDRDHFTIGRAEEATVSINHSSVSRLHAELISLGNVRPMGSFDNVATSVRAPSQGRGLSIGKIVGIGAVLGVLVLGGIILVMRKDTTAPTTTTQDPGMSALEAQVLKDANDLVEGKDFEGAHRKLQAISDSSPVREGQPFKDVEAKWADWMFSKAEHASDSAEKRRTLQQIASTPSVDADRRKHAADMLQSVAGPEPTPGVNAPQGGPYVAPNPGGGGTTTSAGGATPSGSASASKSADPATSPSVPPAPGNLDEAAMRRGIEGKVWSGKASVEEIKLLIAICKHQRDQACREKANAMLKQKQAATP
jgi:ABC transport system ATP-binding/permease protein